MARLILFIASALFLLMVLRKKEIPVKLLYFAVSMPVVMQFAAAVYYRAVGVNDGMSGVTFIPILIGLLSSVAGAFPTWYTEYREEGKRIDEILKHEELNSETDGNMTAPENSESLSPEFEKLEKLVKPFITAAVCGLMLCLIVVRIIGETGRSSVAEWYYFPLFISFLASPFLVSVIKKGVGKSFIMLVPGTIAVIITSVIASKMYILKPDLHISFSPGVYIVIFLSGWLFWSFALAASRMEGLTITTTYRNTYKNGVFMSQEKIGEMDNFLENLKLSPDYFKFFYFFGIWMLADSLLRCTVFITMFLLS